MLFFAAALTLQLELTRHSLTGTHDRYGQYLDGQRVVGAEVDVTIRPDGTIDHALRGRSASGE